MKHSEDTLLIAAVALALALASPPVSAANLAPPVNPFTKAMAKAPCTVLSCSGWEAGFHLAGVGGTADILGGGLSALTANGGMLGLSGGYKFWNGNVYFAPHVSGYYQVNVNPAVTVTMQPRWLFTETIDFGMGLQALFGGGTPTGAPVPSQGPIPINIPASLSASLISPFVRVGAAQRDVLHEGWVTGGGADFVIAQSWDMKATIMSIAYRNGKEMISDLGLTYHF